MRKLLIALGAMTLVMPALHAQYDDIYYNPKSENSAVKKKKAKSYYIKDFSNMDVDEYNRASDMYYETPVDTIGMRTETGQDFVYTQKIQKYYNPTIVVDNVDLLQDVLNNSYGNVEVVINDVGLPVFQPYYVYPSYYSWNWRPGFSFSWNWGPSWAWGPSWGWNWGPFWACGPSWSWNCGPSWAWGPSWGPGWGPAWRPAWSGGWNRPFYADYRPNSHRPVRPSGGWGHATAPGYNHNGGYAPGSHGRPGGYKAPVSGNGSSDSSGNRYVGNRRGYNSVDYRSESRYNGNGNNKTDNKVSTGTSSNRSNRYQYRQGIGTSSAGSAQGYDRGNGYTGNRRYSTTTNSSEHKTQGASTGTTTTGSSHRNYNTTTTTTPSRTYNYNSGSSNRSYNSGSSRRSYNSGSSNRSYNSGSNRSYGGSRSSGGYSGGSHRGGGGGHRR